MSVYRVTVDGVTRTGDFIIDGELRRTSLTISEPSTEWGGDLLEVSIRAADAEDCYEEAWMVLWGRPSHILRITDEDLPMSEAETKAISEHLSMADEESDHILTYSLMREQAPVASESGPSRVLRAAQRDAIASLFERCPMEVTVVNVK